MTGVSFTRQSAVVLVGIGVLLVAGAVGWGAIGAESSGGAVPAPDGDGPTELQNESDGNESVITSNQTVEALLAAENRTNGTVFEARLSGEPGGGLNESAFVYELDVLAENGSHLVVQVYAANATVIGFEPANDSDGVFAEIFGSSDDVPEGARDASELRSAAEALRLAVNETGPDTENLTVTQVMLETRDDELLYRVQQFDPGGERREVLVAATGEGEEVVTTDPEADRALHSAVQ